MTTIDEILQELKPYQDKVVISPVTEEEVQMVQSKFKRTLPEYFIEFLRKIGLKQDLVWGLNNGINKFQDLADFLPSEDYFRFGDNGGEDYWLLKFEDENDRTIYEYYYYSDGEIKSLGKTFDELLLEGLENIKERYDSLPLNDEKKWCVQFCVETSSGDFLLSQLKDKLDIPIKIIKETEYQETSVAGVKCYEGVISINGKETPLKKQVIKGMGSSSLYFNWQESVDTMNSDSTIKKLDKVLSSCVFKHILIDNGIVKI